MDPTAIRIEDGIISLAEAAELIPSPRRKGQRLDPSCVWRWVKTGMKVPGGERIKLSAVLLGKSWFTTRAAVNAFIQALAEARRPARELPGTHSTYAEAAGEITSETAPTPKRKQSTSASRQRRAEKAGQELEKLGA